jgi:NADH:ubiquinone oxidoreductase subunit 2 (subunit N)
VKYLVFTAAILKYLYIPAAIGVAVSLLGAYYYLQFVTTALFEAVNRVYPIRVLLPARVRIFVPTLEAILLLSPLSAPLIIAAMSAIVIAVSATDLYLMVFVDHNSFYFICSL